jgi:hypothetical protein
MPLGVVDLAVDNPHGRWVQAHEVEQRPRGEHLRAAEDLVPEHHVQPEWRTVDRAAETSLSTKSDPAVAHGVSLDFWMLSIACEGEQEVVVEVLLVVVEQFVADTP